MKSMVLIYNLSNQFTGSILRRNFVIRFKINQLEMTAKFSVSLVLSKKKKKSSFYSKPSHYC